MIDAGDAAPYGADRLCSPSVVLMLLIRCFGMALTALALVCAQPAAAAPKAFVGPEVALGAPNAPITVIEYGSDACSHCARFNNEVFPQFKAKYVDTGKVRYIFREYLTQPAEFAAAGFLMARCIGQDKYLAVLDDVFHAQDKIYKSQKLLEGLQAIGAKYGLSKANFDACVRDPRSTKALTSRQLAADDAGIGGTPTFLINKERLEGEVTLGDLMLVIEPMLAAMAVSHP